MLCASRNNVPIRSVGLHEPTLEDVFLKFTGKKIREAETNGQGKMMARMWHRRK
jgi:ABC-2 type transport system ATP-binding protein